MSVQFLSPVGRMVQGDAFAPQTTNQQGQPRVFQTGPKAGQPNPQWFIALAFRKDDPHWPAFYQVIRNESAAAWPSLFPQGPNGPCTSPIFAMKVIDGDGFDTTGKANNTKEGFAGHWVVRFTSGFQPKVFEAGKYDPMQVITDPARVKRGYYYRIGGTIESNKNITKPGMYINCGLLEIAGFGAEIVSGPDAATVFSAPAGALPPGASAIPLAPGAATPPPPPAAPPPAAPPPAAPPHDAPPHDAPPHDAWAPPARVMLPAAGGQTYDAMILAGWTDAQLVQHGMMAAPVPQSPGAGAAPPPAAPAAPPTPPTAPAAPPPAPTMKSPSERMTPAATATYDQYIEAQWTEAQLIANGLMLPA